MKIYLNSFKDNKSINNENTVGVQLDSNSKLLPVLNINKNIDAYEQYVAESDASNLYRLTFTINPICTNILFNAITEVVKDEGTKECFNFTSLNTFTNVSNSIKKYNEYTERGIGCMQQPNLIKDTGYSHPKIGNLTYHCGSDIFNNHLLRKKEFVCVNKLGANLTRAEKEDFNTIGDTLRTFNGEIITDVNTIFGNNFLNNKFVKQHLYNYDTLYTFSESISENLIEVDGWVGFNNVTTLDINNYNNLSINKVINNKKPFQMIDMYPERDLFSFIPKVNDTYNRLEPNWKYCLTYPSENYYDNSLIKNKETGTKGISTKLITTINETLNDDSEILFKTVVSHNFIPNNKLTMYFIVNGEEIKVNNDIIVTSIGKDNYDQYVYFSVYYDNISDYSEYLKNNVEIRIRKIVNGIECDYYIRLFKKLPQKTFQNKEFYDFNSSLNKLAFAKNIYGDDIAQIIYNDDIDISVLRDNLGRPLSNIYLTIIKANDGYKEWYGKTSKYNSSAVTYSHCFGKLTSGFDLYEDVYDYNVHKIHNIEIDDKYKHILGLVDSVKNLEENLSEITIDGDGYFGDKSEKFFGDLVELNKSEVIETVLENVYFRFNTAQREYTIFDENNDGTLTGKYCNLYYDEIEYDDDEYNFSFSVSKNKLYNIDTSYNLDGTIKETLNYPINLYPEGYFYKAHRRIKLKEFKTELQQASHIPVGFYNVIKNERENTNCFTITIINNYTLFNDSIILLYHKKTKEKYIAKIEECNDKIVTFNVNKEVENLDDYHIYKYNTNKPLNAIELDDGTGRYVWKEFKSCNDFMNGEELFNRVFANGRHYINDSFNFYLKRQDPFGIHKLNYINAPNKIMDLTFEGKEKDVEQYEYVEETKYEKC